MGSSQSGGKQSNRKLYIKSKCVLFQYSGQGKGQYLVLQGTYSWDFSVVSETAGTVQPVCQSICLYPPNTVCPPVSDKSRAGQKSQIKFCKM